MSCSEFIDFIKFILTHNHLQFNNVFYTQIFGSAWAIRSVLFWRTSSCTILKTLHYLTRGGQESGTPIFMTPDLRGFFYHKKRVCQAVHSIRLCVKSYSSSKFEIIAIFYDLWYICPNDRIQTYTYNLYVLIGFYVIQKHNKYISFK